MGCCLGRSGTGGALTDNEHRAPSIDLVWPKTNEFDYRKSLFREISEH